MANIANIEFRLVGNEAGAFAMLDSAGNRLEMLQARSVSFAGSIKSAWLEASASLAAITVGIKKAWDLAEAAAGYQEQVASLGALGAAYGITGEQIVSRLQDITGGLLSSANAANVASNALTQGLAPDQLFEVARAAEVLSNVTGQKLSAQLESLTRGLVLGKEKSLELAIGTIDLKSRYGELADKMSDTEKIAARYTIVMERVAAIQADLGEAASSTADDMERMRAQIEDIGKFIGGVLIRLGAFVLSGFQGVAGSASIVLGALVRVAQGFAWVTDQIGITKGAFEAYGRVADSLRESGEDLKAKQAATWNVAVSGADAYTSSVNRAGDALKKLREREEERQRQLKAEAEAKEAARKGKAAAEAMERVEERIAKDTSPGALSPVMAIQLQAREWEKLGVKRVAIERWVGAEMAKLEIQAAEILKKSEEKAAQEESARRESMIGFMLRAEIIERGRAEQARLRGESELKAAVTIAENAEKVAAAEREANEKAVRDWEEKVRLAERLVAIGREQSEIEADRLLSFISQGPGGSEMASGMSALAGVDPETQAYQRWLALQDEKIQALERSEADQAAIRAAYRDYERVESEAAERRKLTIAQGAFSALSGLAQAFYAASGNRSKEAFRLYQTFAIAEAMVSTIKATQDAFSWGMKFGGPPLAAAFAAAAVASGLARVAQIAAQRPGGTATGSAGVGYGGAVPTLPVGSSAPAATEREPAPPVVNVHVYGHIVNNDEFVREIIPQITKGYMDGVR